MALIFRRCVNTCRYPRTSSGVTDSGGYSASRVATALALVRFNSTSSTPPPSPRPTIPPTLTARRHGAPYTQAEDELIQGRRLAGMCFKDIAAELGVDSVGSVIGRYHHLRKTNGLAASRMGNSHQVRRLRYRRVTQAEKDLVVQRYNEGASFDDMARETNRTFLSLQRIVHDLLHTNSGIKRRRVSNPPLTSDEIVRIRAWREERVKWKDIAMRLDRNLPSMRQLFRSYLHPVDSRHRPWTAAEKAMVMELKRSGASLLDIGASVNRSEPSIAMVLLRMKKAAASAKSDKEEPRQVTAKHADPPHSITT